MQLIEGRHRHRHRHRHDHHHHDRHRHCDHDLGSRQRKQVLAINALRLPSKRIKLAAKASLLICTVI